MLPRPATGDYAELFQSYINLVPDGDALEQLPLQATRMQALLTTAGEAKGEFAYADAKWTTKQVLLHLSDSERVFCYRAMCVARGDTTDLPSLDEKSYAMNDGSANRTLRDIVEEYATVRAATVTLFRGFNDDAWQRRGTANGQPLTVSAAPWIILGHDLHHWNVLQERYGLSMPS